MEVMVKSIPMHYEEFGTGIPIIMLHGWPSDHRHMVASMEPVFQHRTGWRRIYPDLPGMGKTPGASWITRQDHMLDVVVAFLQQVAPDQRYVVAGASFGGYLVRGLVHEQGDMIDSVLLIVPVVETDPTKENIPPQQVLLEDPQFLLALTPEEAKLSKLFIIQSYERLEFFRTFIQPAMAVADHAFLEHLEEHYAFSFAVDTLPQSFPGPTLIVTGRQDSNCGYREAWTVLEENYPRGTFAVLDRADHGLALEQKALFQALTQEWLQRVEEYISQTSK